MKHVISTAMALCLFAMPGWPAKKEKAIPLSPHDRYILEATSGPGNPSVATSSPGSIWFSSARFSDLARDLRASQVNDLVTILVVERASAVAKGSTKTARASSVKSSVKSLAGPTMATGPLAELANLSGATTRETVLTTTLSARVTHVLPNGYLVLEGAKDLEVNSEHQKITVRGVVRPADLNSGNLVRSDRLAQLEVRVNGKGVVGDAVRRPFFLYRILLGLLPF